MHSADMLTHLLRCMPLIYMLHFIRISINLQNYVMTNFSGNCKHSCKDKLKCKHNCCKPNDMKQSIIAQAPKPSSSSVSESIGIPSITTKRRKTANKQSSDWTIPLDNNPPFTNDFNRNSTSTKFKGSSFAQNKPLCSLNALMFQEGFIDEHLSDSMVQWLKAFNRYSRH